MEEYQISENIRKLILESIVSFGPNGYGPNILCIPNINKNYVLFNRCIQEIEGEIK